MTRPRWIAGAVVLGLAIVLPLAAAEIVLRVSGAVPPSIFEPDSALLYKIVPGGRKTFTHRPANGGASIDIRINRDGFRGPPLRRDGAFRVMVYGDSFIEGEFAEDSMTFTRMLERTLSRTQPAEAINAGVLGWGPDQAYLRMQRDLPTYKPNLVVLAIFADNDMGDLVRDRLVALRPDSTLAFRHPVLHPTLATLLSAQAHPRGWRWFYLARWVERKLGRANTAILPAMRQRDPLKSLAVYDDWALANARQQYEEFQSSPDTVFDFLGDSYDVDISATPDSPSARTKVALMDRLLGAMQRDFTARGIPFALLVIPSPIDICEAYDVVIDTVKYPNYRRRRISGIVDSLATRNGIKHVDLWPTFRANDPCALYYRQGDLHWKAKGQEIAASLLADSLAAWGFTR